MAFAKKFTRHITVAGEEYLWYLRDNSLDFEPRRRVAVQHATAPGQLLVVDLFDVCGALGAEIRPRTVREAILFGLAHGWRPAGKGVPLVIRRDGAAWVVSGEAGASATV